MSPSSKSTSSWKSDWLTKAILDSKPAKRAATPSVSLNHDLADLFSHEEETSQVMTQAEKLKQDWVAKFKKGHFKSARELAEVWKENVQAMKKKDDILDKDAREFFSTLQSLLQDYPEKGWLLAGASMAFLDVALPKDQYALSEMHSPDDDFGRFFHTICPISDALLIQDRDADWSEKYLKKSVSSLSPEWKKAFQDYFEHPQTPAELSLFVSRLSRRLYGPEVCALPLWILSKMPHSPEWKKLATADIKQLWEELNHGYHFDNRLNQQWTVGVRALLVKAAIEKVLGGDLKGQEEGFKFLNLALSKNTIGHTRETTELKKIIQHLQKTDPDWPALEAKILNHSSLLEWLQGPTHFSHLGKALPMIQFWHLADILNHPEWIKTSWEDPEIKQAWVLGFQDWAKPFLNNQANMGRNPVVLLFSKNSGLANIVSQMLLSLPAVEESLEIKVPNKETKKNQKNKGKSSVPSKTTKTVHLDLPTFLMHHFFFAHPEHKNESLVKAVLNGALAKHPDRFMKKPWGSRETLLNQALKSLSSADKARFNQVFLKNSLAEANSTSTSAVVAKRRL